jgi:hypothetical protein
MPSENCTRQDLVLVEASVTPVSTNSARVILILQNYGQTNLALSVSDKQAPCIGYGLQLAPGEKVIIKGWDGNVSAIGDGTGGLLSLFEG